MRWIKVLFAPVQALLWTLAWALLNLLIGILVMEIAPHEFPSLKKMGLIWFLYSIAFLIPTGILLSFVNIKRRPPVASRSLSRPEIWLTCILILPVAVQIVGSEIEVIARILVTPSESYLKTIELLSNDDQLSTSLGLLFTAGVVGPICEEILFRGIVQDSFSKAWKSQTAIIIGQAFLFGIVHLQFWQALYAFPVGILFGCIRLWSKSIVPSIVIHIFANSLGLIYGHFIYTEKVDPLLIEHVPIPLLLAGFSALVFGTYVIYQRRIRNTTEETGYR